MKVIIRIAQCRISSEGFLIKEAWIVDSKGKFVSKANINDKFAIAMKGNDIELQVAAAVKTTPNKEPKIEFKDPRQQDMFLDE